MFEELDISTLPVKAEPITPHIYAVHAEALAAELAMELDEPDVIAQRHGLSEAQLATFMGVPAFQQLLGLHKAAWDAADNTTQRIEKKAAMALEQILLPVSLIGLNPASNDAMVLQSAKLLKDVSPLGDRSRQPVGAGNSIQLNINLDGTPVSLSFDQVVPLDVIEADV